MLTVTNATTVNATYSLAENGLTGVALFLSDGTNFQQTAHGAYSSREVAWRIAEYMVARLKSIIATRGSYTHDDVERVHRQAEAAVTGPRVEFG